jgi:hypothetical protein
MIAMQRHPLEAMVGTCLQLDQTDDDDVRSANAEATLVSGRCMPSLDHLRRSCRSYRGRGNIPHDEPNAYAQTVRQRLLYCASAEITLSPQARHVMSQMPFVLLKRPKRGWSNAVACLQSKGGAIDYKLTYPAQHATASQCLTRKVHLRQKRFRSFQRSPRTGYGPAPLYERNSQ